MLGIKEYRKLVLQERAIKWMKENYKKIKATGGNTCYYNHRCHLNSRNNYFKDPERYSVHMILCNDGGNVIVHFINKDEETGIFFDDTLGYEIKYMNDIRYVREIKEIREIERIGHVLNDMKKKIKKGIKMNLFDRFLFQGEDVF